ncbi:MAG: hypothetical protein ACYDAL_12310 [Candidatus Dormibacteraceae bacterium]
MDADSRVEDTGPGWAQRLVGANRAGWRRMVLAALGVAVTVAVYDLVTGWEVPNSPLAAVVTIALLVFAVATCVAVLVFSRYETRTLAAGAGSEEVVRVAERGVRWSSVFAIGICVVLFANCSAGVTSGDRSIGASAHPSQFWPLAALVMLPLLVAIAIPAGLAMGASRVASRGRMREAGRLASVALWSAGLVAVVALVTAGIAFFGGVSQCFLDSTSSSCAAGVAGLLNPTAIGSLLVIVPYLRLMKPTLAAASPGPDG